MARIAAVVVVPIAVVAAEDHRYGLGCSLERLGSRFVRGGRQILAVNLRKM